MGQVIWQTIVDEFSGGSDLRSLTTVVIRLLLAALLGGVIGFEREHKGKSAGLRTHILVSLGAALFVLVPQQTGAAPGDMTRVLQGLMAGIGFLGAGAIIKGRSLGNDTADTGIATRGASEADPGSATRQADDPNEIHGLTTAASIWMVSAIGMAAGIGREMTAIVATGLALVVLTLLLPLDDLLSSRKRSRR